MDEINQNDPAFIAALLDAVRKGGTVNFKNFARLTGTDERAVKRAWENGQLPTVQFGEIPFREGVVALVSADGLRPKKAVPQFLLDADAAARELVGLPPRETAPAAAQSADAIEALKLKYLAAKTMASRAQSEKLKLETDIKKGVFVPRVEVELDAATTATQVSAALMQMPIRLAGMCAGLPAEQIAEIIRDEIAHVVRTIQESAFTGDWGNE